MDSGLAGFCRLTISCSNSIELRMFIDERRRPRFRFQPIQLTTPELAARVGHLLPIVVLLHFRLAQYDSCWALSQYTPVLPTEKLPVILGGFSQLLK
jgi:hypothetical protein